VGSWLRRTFEGHVAQGDVAYTAVGLGLQRVRKRFDPKDIARFRERQRRVGCLPEPTRNRARAPASSAPEVIDFKALLRNLRAEKRATRESSRL
jgi:hypothetical protein